MCQNLLNSLILVLLVNLTLSAIVPRIQNNDVQLEPVGDHKYTLKINDFGVVREETVEEIAPGEFLVKGQLNQLYFPESGRLIVTYEAGPNGYVAKYSYIKEEGVMLPAVGLSADALKAAAG
ncbi:uncharacterized protein LOC6557904 [Drosophila grimshawi]|uniref:uncharacterized protein LOC6557904 n=1 Tax=Drosophila grimshawi TaxID=7222 RepID=UPI000C8708A5|nr:uncharacterized protein LOC6557904 [Drosophila grimshawi]